MGCVNICKGQNELFILEPQVIVFRQYFYGDGDVYRSNGNTTAMSGKEQRFQAGAAHCDCTSSSLISLTFLWHPLSTVTRSIMKKTYALPFDI